MPSITVDAMSSDSSCHDESRNADDRAHRPWGCWRVVDEGSRFKVKRLEVSPRQRLSYQTHQYRAEHWTVVAGTATCVLNDQVLFLSEGEHLFVPVGAPHRISNDADKPLVIIETQIGSYTGEDDIVRLVDDYHRAG